jgi:CHAT domain-containing protein
MRVLINLATFTILACSSTAQPPSSQATIESAKSKAAWGDTAGAEKELREVAASAQQQSEAGIHQYLDAMQVLANMLYARGAVEELAEVSKQAQAALLASSFFNDDVKANSATGAADFLSRAGKLQDARSIIDNLLQVVNLASLERNTRHHTLEIAGEILVDTGLPDKGRELLQSLFDEVSPDLGDDHLRLHYLHFLLARACMTGSDFACAADHFNDAATHAGLALGETSDIAVNYRIEGAEALLWKGETKAALARVQPLLASLEKRPPVIRFNAIRVRGYIRFQQRLFYEASVDFREALKLADELGGSALGYVTQLKSTLADALLSSGALYQAWPIVDELEASVQPNDPFHDRLRMFNQLRKARVLIAINDQEKAAELLSRARSYLEKNPDDLLSETNIIQLEAQLYTLKRQDDEAVRRLTDLWTRLNASSRTDLKDSRDSTALLLIPLVMKSDENKALEIVEQAFGATGSDDVDANFRNYTAEVYRTQVQQSRFWRKPDPAALAALRIACDRLKANPIAKLEPQTIRGSMYVDATLCLAEGKVEEAHRFAERVLDLDLAFFRELLRHGSQYQRMNALEGLQDQPQDLPALVQHPAGVLRASFYVKSALLDSLVFDTAQLERLRGDNAEFINKLEKLREEYRTMRLQPATATPEIKSTRSKALQLLGDEIEEAERKLSIQHSDENSDLQFSLDLIRKKIPANGAIVDYVDFKSRDGVHYGVAILPKVGKIEWVDLGSKRQIDATVAKAANAWRTGTPQAFASASAECSQLIWIPVLKFLGRNVRSLLVSPWPTLTEIPFAFLPDESGAESVRRFDIALIRSTRELFRLNPRSRTANKVLLVHGGNFGGVGTGKDYFPELLGVGEELAAIQSELNTANIGSDLVVPGEATEERVKTAHGYGVMHIASHGFFVNRRERGAADPKKDSADAIFVSALPSELDAAISQGIALRGAGTTIDERLAGTSVDPDSDGLLTIDEIASADWRGTWLAVFSTCDSGRGPSSATGRFSVVFAATRSGVENAVVCLWQVGDFSTAALMGRFYHEMLTGKAPFQAVSATQRWWLEKNSSSQANETLRHAAALTCWASGDRWAEPAPIKPRGPAKAQRKR